VTTPSASRRRRIPRILVSFGLGILLMVTGAVTWVARSWQAEYQLIQLQSEIESCEKASLANRSRLDLLIKSEDSTRLIFGLPPIHSDVRRVGVGGPADPTLTKTSLSEKTQGYLSRAAPSQAATPFNLQSPSERASKLLSELEASSRMTRLSMESMEAIEQKMKEIDEQSQYMPSIIPMTGVITSKYGPRNDPITGLYTMHNGIDIAAALGTPVIAPAHGIVMLTGVDTRYGLYVDLDHQNGFRTRYGHLSTILVEKGSRIERGDVLGRVGMTGRTTGYHLHYEVRKNGRKINPIDYIRSDNGC